MKEFFRICECGHRESQHKLVVKKTDYERTKCRKCKCKQFILKVTKQK